MNYIKKVSAKYKVSADADQVEVEELVQFVQNESKLYKQKQAIILNLMKKMKAGKYEHHLAPKLWIYLMNEGNKLYQKDFGTGLSVAVRRKAAEEIADYERDLIESGEYDSMVKSEAEEALGLGDGHDAKIGILEEAKREGMQLAGRLRAAMVPESSLREAVLTALNAFKATMEPKLVDIAPINMAALTNHYMNGFKTAYEEE